MNDIGNKLMKTLSIATIMLTLSISISANASLKVGDTLVLKKDLQSISSDSSSILINGKPASSFRRIKTTGCIINLTDRDYRSESSYSKGDVFSVKSIEKGLLENKEIFTTYRGSIVVTLQSKNAASEEVLTLGCSTEENLSKTAANLQTPEAEVVVATFNDLF